MCNFWFVSYMHISLCMHLKCFILKEQVLDDDFMKRFNEIYMDLGGLGERVLG